MLIIFIITLKISANDILYNKIFYEELYIHNKSNHIIKKNNIENNQYFYDNEEKLFQKIEKNGIITKYSYNSNNQLKNKKIYNNDNLIGSYYYYYNKNGQLSSIEHFDNINNNKNLIETIYFEYSINGNLLSKIVYDLNGGYKYYYRYDINNKLVQIKYCPFYLPESHILLYEYDKNGLIVKEMHLYFLDSDNINIEIDYNPDTMIPTKIITTEYKYDKESRLIKSSQSDNNINNETYYFYKD